MSIIDCAKQRRNLLLYDSFDGTNGTLLDGRTPDINKIGAAWESPLGGIDIRSNTARATTLASGGAISVVECGTADGIMTAVWQSGSTSGDTDFGQLIFRYQDAANYWALTLGKIAGSNRFRISEIVGGTETVRATATAGYSALNSHVLWLRFVGATIEARSDGGNDLSYTSAATFLTASKVGIAFGMNATISTLAFFNGLQVFGL